MCILFLKLELFVFIKFWARKNLSFKEKIITCDERKILMKVS